MRLSADARDELQSRLYSDVYDRSMTWRAQIMLGSQADRRERGRSRLRCHRDDLGQGRREDILDSIPLRRHATVEKAATAVTLPHFGRLHHGGSAAGRRRSGNGLLTNTD